MIDKRRKTGKAMVRSMWIAGYIATIVVMLVLLAITALQRAEDNQRIINTSLNTNQNTK